MKKTAPILLILFLTIISGKLLAQDDFSSPGGYINFQNDSVGNYDKPQKKFQSKVNATMLSEQAWVTFMNNIYFEARYNYEAYQTATLFIGWDKKFGDDCNGLEIYPMIAPMFGTLNGGAAAFDFQYTTCITKLESDNEYVYGWNTATGTQNYFYDWTKLYAQGRIYPISAKPGYFKFGGGISFQAQAGTQQLLWAGVMVRATIFKIIGLEGYWYYDDLKNRGVYAVALDLEK